MVEINEKRDFFYGFKKFKKRDEKEQFKLSIKGAKELSEFLEMPKRESWLFSMVVKEVFKNKYNQSMVNIELPNCYLSYFIRKREGEDKTIRLSSISYK